jgi:hypothetical protein
MLSTVYGRFGITVFKLIVSERSGMWEMNKLRKAPKI